MCPTAIGNREQGAVGLQRPRVDSARPGKSVVLPDTVLGSGLISSALTAVPKIRACILAENHLVREVLCRSLAKHEKITAVGGPADGVLTSAGIPKKPIDVLVLVSSERVQADLEQISAIRKQAPGLKILLMGSVKEDAEFLRFVRAANPERTVRPDNESLKRENPPDCWGQRLNSSNLTVMHIWNFASRTPKNWRKLSAALLQAPYWPRVRLKISTPITGVWENWCAMPPGWLASAA